MVTRRVSLQHSETEEDIDSMEFPPKGVPCSPTGFKRWIKPKSIGHLPRATRCVFRAVNKYKKLLLALVIIASILLFSPAHLRPDWFLAKSPKVVIILAANQGGGVFKWKGPQEWSIERSSIANKKNYARRHGYGLTIKDITLKKRYSHEWRESWEKVDLLKQAMAQYPQSEWFWWLDLHTYIMEPHRLLESQFLNDLNNATCRTLSEFNPLEIPEDLGYVDYTHPINMVITQDCGGFNLGSFMVRRSEWTDLLLDAWWDPVMYEQMHMEWEHKEQDALETLYSRQPWIRDGVSFLPLRKINAFPYGACSDSAEDGRYFYQEGDFVINMAGCQYGRDCWAEMEHYKAVQKRLARWWRLW